ncbi:MAG: redoxin family protein [Phycisphaerae bacterium]|nr:redoxin family protein [Phycisphaerae bacterium]
MKSTKLIATFGLIAALAGGAAAFAQTAPSTKTDDKTTEKGKEAPREGRKAGEGKKAAKAASLVGQPAPAFTLKDSAGKSVSLSDYAGKVVVLEWMNPGCPVCKGKMADGSVGKMIAAARELNKDVVFLFINSTAATADKPAASGEYLAAYKVESPALIDGDGKVGKAYGAKTTPHCFVIDAKGVLVYDGAIDNEGSTNYVVNAVKALKEGAAVTPATTTPYGCSVKYARPSAS